MLEMAIIFGGLQFSLESRVAVEGEVVFDQTVGHLARHLAVGHFMLGQVLGGEARAIDAGGDLVLVFSTNVEVLELGQFAVCDVTVCCDLAKVNHGGWLAGGCGYEGVLEFWVSWLCQAACMEVVSKKKVGKWRKNKKCPST
jgi:hypothetical protein